MLWGLTGQIYPLASGQNNDVDASLLLAYDTPTISANKVLNESSWLTTYDGTIYGASVAAGSFFFDGVDDRIAIPWSMTRPFTISCWLRKSATSTRAIMLGGSSFSNWPRYRITSSRTVLMELGSDNTISSQMLLNNNQWTMITTVMAENHANSMIYFNSIADTNLNIYTPFFTAKVGQATTYLACHTDNIGCWDGNIGNINIYNRTLAAADVATLFAQQRAKYGV